MNIILKYVKLSVFQKLIIISKKLKINPFIHRFHFICSKEAKNNVEYIFISCSCDRDRDYNDRWKDYGKVNYEIIKCKTLPNGNYHGIYKELNNKRQIRVWRKYNNGKIMIYAEWDCGGIIRFSGNSNIENFHYESGQIAKTILHIGKLGEIIKTWSKKGLPLKIQKKINDNLDGKQSFWYENGEPKENCIYITGKKNGLYQFWHINGQIKEISYYKDDLRHGRCQIWNTLGELIRDIIFMNGVECDKI